MKKFLDKVKLFFGYAVDVPLFDDQTKPSVFDASTQPISTRSIEHMLKHSRPGYKCHVHWEKL